MSRLDEEELESLLQGTRVADEDREAELREELWREGMDDSPYDYDRFSRRLVRRAEYGGPY